MSPDEDSEDNLTFHFSLFWNKFKLLAKYNPAGCSVKAIFAFAQLWVTAIKQGLVSACYFWVGSDVPIEGNVLACYMDINRQQFCNFFGSR